MSQKNIFTYILVLKFGELIALINSNFNMRPIFLILNVLHIPYVYSTNDGKVQLSIDLVESLSNKVSVGEHRLT